MRRVLLQCGQRSDSLIDERRVARWIGSLARESICERIPHEASKTENSRGAEAPESQSRGRDYWASDSQRVGTPRRGVEPWMGFGYGVVEEYFVAEIMTLVTMAPTSV